MRQNKRNVLTLLTLCAETMDEGVSLPAWPHTLVIPPHLLDDFEQGTSLFTAGEFWESHEEWERVWIALDRNQTKIAVQVLIQTAACGVLMSQGRLKGFYRKQHQIMYTLEGLWILGIRQLSDVPLRRLFTLHHRIREMSDGAFDATQLTPCFQRSESR